VAIWGLTDEGLRCLGSEAQRRRYRRVRRAIEVGSVNILGGSFALRTFVAVWGVCGCVWSHFDLFLWSLISSGPMRGDYAGGIIISCMLQELA
jgi:hypothetical protein